MKKTLIALLGVALYTQMALARTAPSFHGELLGGGRVSLSGLLRQDRTLLLCFWATWCVPCLEELKMVKDQVKASPNLALDVVTVNVDNSEQAADIRPTMKQHGQTFPVITDPRQEIFSKFQKEKALPFSVLINGKGEILQTFMGLHENMFATIEKAIADDKGIAQNATP